MFNDFRFAARSLAKTPGFTLIAVLTLVVGLGAATTVCSWAERILLDPLPGARASDRIMAIETLAPSGEMIDTSYPDYRDYAAQSRAFSAIVVHRERPLNLGEGERAMRVWAQFVSGNFFTTLGLSPRAGRFFAEADRADTPAAAPVVVISESLWRRQLGAAPDVVGKTIRLNQHEFTVIGVAPAEFPGSLNGVVFDLWLPVPQLPILSGTSNWLENRSTRPLHVLGRLAPGVSREEAQSELAVIAQGLAAANPKSNHGIGVAVLPLIRSPHGMQSSLARPLVLLLGICGLVLVIVCANLSNLLFVRASARQREMCLRQALGAGWGRLVRQLMAESILLGLAGVAGAWLLTLWLSDGFRHLLPASDLPLVVTGQLDLRVFAISALLALLTATVAGLTPALWAARLDLVSALRASGRGSGLTPPMERWRAVLVAMEVTLTVVTLVCAGLATKSFYQLRLANPGFDPNGVLLAAVKLDASGYTRETGRALLPRLQARLATLPGVESAAIAESVPLGLSGGSWEDVDVPGYVPAPNENMKIYKTLVTPGYFALMRIPVRHGRDFDAHDDAAAPSVVIVNETFARRFFGTTDPVGRTFKMWGGARALRIVGVVADCKYRSLNEPAMPYFYLSFPQFFSPSDGLGLHVRMKPGTDPMAALPSLRAAVRELDPNVPVFEAMALNDYIGAARYVQKVAAQLLGGLAVLAIALSALGLYGVMAFSVAQRTAEFGVRLALGATPQGIVRLVLRRGTWLIVPGLLTGGVVALGVTRVLARFFYGTAPLEPVLLVGAVALIVPAAFFACWLPARRAGRVSPMEAMRAE